MPPVQDSGSDWQRINRRAVRWTASAFTQWKPVGLPATPLHPLTASASRLCRSPFTTPANFVRIGICFSHVVLAFHTHTHSARPTNFPSDPRTCRLTFFIPFAKQQAWPISNACDVSVVDCCCLNVDPHIGFGPFGVTARSGLKPTARLPSPFRGVSCRTHGRRGLSYVSPVDLPVPRRLPR